MSAIASDLPIPQVIVRQLQVGATNLHQNFALEKTFLQIVWVGNVLFIQKGRKKEIRHNPSQYDPLIALESQPVLP